MSMPDLRETPGSASSSIAVTHPGWRRAAQARGTTASAVVVIGGRDGARDNANDLNSPGLDRPRRYGRKATKRHPRRCDRARRVEVRSVGRSGEGPWSTSSVDRKACGDRTPTIGQRGRHRFDLRSILRPSFLSRHFLPVSSRTVGKASKPLSLPPSSSMMRCRRCLTRPRPPKTAK